MASLGLVSGSYYAVTVLDTLSVGELKRLTTADW